jgi:hypothetical protein
MNNQNPEFLALQKKWYKKLADEGYKDIEQADGLLKSWNFGRKDHIDLGVRAIRAEYYRLAGQFCYVHKFKSSLEKAIWQMHSEGISIRRISRALWPKNPDIYLDRNRVYITIKKLAKVMIVEARNGHD